MSFDSLVYLVFLPLVYILYRGLARRGQNWSLIVASYIFYGWWDTRFLFLIALSTSIDYCCGLLIDRERLSRNQWTWSAGWSVGSALAFLVVDPVSWSVRGLGIWVLALLVPFCLGLPLLGGAIASLSEETRRRSFLNLSIIANLGILGVFKYYGFFVETAEDLAAALGVGEVGVLHLNVVLPVGISFYTFQTMSYSLDIYRGNLKPTENFRDFALFVSFFPQLVAGPIERAAHLLPAITRKRAITIEQTSEGLFLILFGLFKKIAIANGVAGSVDSIFSSAGTVSTLDVCIATLLFAAQIYCDFSGYSDIARGTSKLFGIELMVNFRRPYFSTNPREFWERWHISLSSWLRDYLYVSMGGNRKGRARTYRNLMITMLLGGLWHGAAWNYVLWGAYHGTVLCVHRLIQSVRVEASASGLAGKLLRMAGFFGITCYGWLLFRADSLEQVLNFTSLLIEGSGDATISVKRPTFSALLGLPLLLGMDVLAQWRDDSTIFRQLRRPLRSGIYAALVFITILGMSNETSQFIYFQF